MTKQYFAILALTALTSSLGFSSMDGEELRRRNQQNANRIRQEVNNNIYNQTLANQQRVQELNQQSEDEIWANQMASRNLVAGSQAAHFRKK